MRAAVVEAFGPLENHRIGELPDPTPGPGEVVVDVRAADANFPDILVIEGRYQVKPPLPFAPGKAAAGVVSAVGAGVEGIAVGDRVACQVEFGAYAEKVAAPAVNVFPLPDALDFAAAAALGLVYQTAHVALARRARLAPGETVLVLGGAGGIGVASIQLAKALGAARVVATARSADRAETARAAGADAVVPTDAGELRETLRAEVLAATDGHGADVVIDSVGGAVTEAALRAVAWEGRLVVVGFASGDIPTFRANYLLVKNIAVLGLQWSDYRDRTPDVVRAAQAEIFRLATEGRLKPIIAAVHPLADFREALEAIRAGRVHGKVVLSVDG